MKAQFKVHVGARFNALVVWSALEKPKTKKEHTKWICRCDCGEFRVTSGTALKSGGTKSCGCMGQRQHGFSKTREYHIWHGILQRCLVPTNHNYHRYGGRGITISEDWMLFENFLRDMGHRPSPDHSVERKNNSLGYSAENCVWATGAEQNNNKCANVRLVVNGESKTLAQWSHATGISAATLSYRKKSGWSDYDCVMTPVALSPCKVRSVAPQDLGG